MPNLQNLINSHNQNILKNQPQSTPKTCNCLKKENCPMNGLYLTESLLYYATITCNNANYIKYIKEFSKQLLKIAMQTIKSLLTFLPTKTIPNFLSSIEPLKQSSLTQNYNGKLKGHTILTIQLPEGITST